MAGRTCLAARTPRIVSQSRGALATATHLADSGGNCYNFRQLSTWAGMGQCAFGRCPSTRACPGSELPSAYKAVRRPSFGARASAGAAVAPDAAMSSGCSGPRQTPWPASSSCPLYSFPTTQPRCSWKNSMKAARMTERLTCSIGSVSSLQGEGPYPKTEGV